jgi:hypothetical protein
VRNVRVAHRATTTAAAIQKEVKIDAA